MTAPESFTIEPHQHVENLPARKGRPAGVVRVCSIDGCTREAYRTRSMCNPHYMRQYRYGSPHYVAPRRGANLLGRAYGRLTVEARADRGHWWCRCECGTRTRVRAWSLTSAGTTSCGDTVHRRAERPGYGAVHDRLRRDLGRAREYVCVGCDGYAAQWGYDHADLDEMDAPEGAYSVHPEHYKPYCAPCHKRRDMALIHNADQLDALRAQYGRETVAWLMHGGLELRYVANLDELKPPTR